MNGPLTKLRDIIRSYSSVIVAFSGGVDSALVLFVAKEQLGDRALGVIGNSPAYPESELADAIALADSCRLSVRVINTTEHRDPRYLANNADRCFHCRSHLFSALSQLALDEKFDCIADGVHADDLHDHVCGMQAARQYDVRSPLFEAGLGKTAVRALAHDLRLPVWDKPAMACLASRVPHGTPIEISLLSRINQAEAALRSLGFSDFRVRHHGLLARIELCPEDFPRALEHHEKIHQLLSAVGYRHITLDLHPRRRLTATTHPSSHIASAFSF